MYILQQQVHLYVPEANELRMEIDRYVEAERQIETELARRQHPRLSPGASAAACRLQSARATSNREPAHVALRGASTGIATRRRRSSTTTCWASAARRAISQARSARRAPPGGRSPCPGTRPRAATPHISSYSSGQPMRRRW